MTRVAHSILCPTIKVTKVSGYQLMFDRPTHRATNESYALTNLSDLRVKGALRSTRALSPPPSTPSFLRRSLSVASRLPRS